MHSLPRAAITHDHELGDFKEQRRNSHNSEKSSLEVWAGRAPSEGARDEPCRSLP